MEQREKKDGQGLYLRCLGEFEVFYEGKPFHFPRKKAKEALALLVDREGKAMTNQEICDVLWPDTQYDRTKQRNYFHHLYSSLRKILSDIGCEDILIHSYDSYAVDMGLVHGDCFHEEGRQKGLDRSAPYMTQYPWAQTEK